MVCPAAGEDKYIAWSNWKKNFTDYLTLNADLYKDDNVKTAFLWNAIGPQTSDEIRQAVDVKVGEPGEGNFYTSTLKYLDEHFAPLQNVTVARFKFRNCVQGDRSVAEFEVELERLAAECEFDKHEVDSLKNQAVRDQLIFGIRDKNIQRKLLESAKLTLADALQKAKAAEESLKNRDTIGQSTSKSGEFSSDPNFLKFSKFRESQPSHPSQPKGAQSFCNYCKRPGHSIENCRSKPRDGGQNRFPRGIFRGSGRGRSRGRGQIRGAGSNQKAGKQWNLFALRRSVGQTVKGTFCKMPVAFTVDTGADLSVFSKSFVDRLGLSHRIKKEQVPSKVKVGDGNVMAFDGFLDGQIDLQDLSTDASIKVSKSLPCDAILGMDVLKNFSSLDLGEEGPILKMYSAQFIPAQYTALIEEFRHVFDKPMKRDEWGLKGVNPVSIIQLEEGAKPYKAPTRMFPPEHQRVSKSPHFWKQVLLRSRQVHGVICRSL